MRAINQRIICILLAILGLMGANSGFGAGAESNHYVGDGEAVDFAMDLDGTKAIVYLASKSTNEPIQNAKIQLQQQGQKDLKEFKGSASPGVYELALSSTDFGGAQLIVEQNGEVIHSDTIEERELVAKRTTRRFVKIVEQLVGAESDSEANPAFPASISERF